jgi:predicted nucleotidyltransferase component of viral defense system
MVDLTPLQIQIIKQLADSPLKEKYYLTGGTLLSAYYLHHRLSKDLDLFTDSPVDYYEVKKFVDTIKQNKPIRLIEEHKIQDRWEFILKNSEETRLDFANYDFPSLQPHQTFMGITIDSLEDIAANKTMAFLDRNEPKDLFDLYFLITEKNFTVAVLYTLMKNKFKVSIPMSLIYSEFHKSFDSLSTMYPYIITGSEQDKKILIQKIIDYYKHESEVFLQNTLK